MKVIQINETKLPARLKKIRKILQSSGNTIGSVHFRKRSNGELRKMAYRLHVRKPSVAKAPKFKDDGDKYKTINKDRENLQITVLDVNKVVRDKSGSIKGRGAWRTVPLENVERISVRGKVYEVVA